MCFHIRGVPVCASGGARDDAQPPRISGRAAGGGRRRRARHIDTPRATAPHCQSRSDRATDRTRPRRPLPAPPRSPTATPPAPRPARRLPRRTPAPAPCGPDPAARTARTGRTRSRPTPTCTSESRKCSPTGHRRPSREPAPGQKAVAQVVVGIITIVFVIVASPSFIVVIVVPMPISAIFF